MEEQKESLEDAAIYCYILAEDFDSIVNLYSEKINENKQSILGNSYKSGSDWVEAKKQYTTLPVSKELSWGSEVPNPNI